MARCNRWIALTLILLLLCAPMLSLFSCVVVRSGANKDPEALAPGSGGGQSQGAGSGQSLGGVTSGVSADLYGSVTEDPAGGYNIHIDFNSSPLGAYSSDKYFQNFSKEYSEYTVLPNTRTSFDDVGDPFQALRISRKNATSVHNTDALIAMCPEVSELDDTYVVSLSLKVTHKTETEVLIYGRRQGSYGGVTSEFARYTPETGLLTAGDRGVCKLEKDVWYDIALVVNDAEGLYDLYVDGSRMLRDIRYQNSAYIDSTDKNVSYRVSLPTGITDTEFYLDNLAVYNSEDGRPVGYKNDDSVDYEILELPDITVFDAAGADWGDIEDIIGYNKASYIQGHPNGYNSIPFDDAYRYIEVNKETGEYSNLTSEWGEDIPEVGDGYDKYLMLDGYQSGITEAVFRFDHDLMVENKIIARTGREVKEELEGAFGGSDSAYFYDLSSYSTITIEFFVPGETYYHPDYYQFMLYVASGNRDGGISYFAQGIKTNDSRFDGRFYTWEFDLGTLGVNRNASLTTIQSVEFRFTGWSNGLNGVSSGQTSNEHQIGIKSITISGGVEVPVRVPADGYEDCTHTDEYGDSLMTDRFVIAPTCTDYGYMAEGCTVCGKTMPVQNDVEWLEVPTGHRYFDSDGKNPQLETVRAGCITSGYVAALCLNCGMKKHIETLSPIGHEYIAKSMDQCIMIECVNCGDNRSTYYYASLPHTRDIVSALYGIGVRSWWGADFDNDPLFNDVTEFVDDSYDPSTGSGGSYLKSDSGLSITVRNTKLKVLDNEGVDNVGKYVRLYDNTSGLHSYFDILAISGGTLAKDFVFEYAYRLGARGNNGNYITDNVQIIDRNSGAASGSNLLYSIARVGTDGRLSFVNSDFSVMMSETKFTRISLAVHLNENSYDIYIDGVLMSNGVTLNSNPNYDMTQFVCDTVRFGSFQDGTGTYIDIAAPYAYSAYFPVAVVGTETVCNITYHNLDDAGHTNPTESVLDNGRPLVLRDAFKDGYVFMGWYADEEYNTRVTTIDFGGEIELWAKWEYGTGIYDADDLRNMSLDGTYILMSSIDLGGAEWTPIGTETAPFTGAFNGMGCMISNFRVTRGQYAGLFGYSTGSISALAVSDFTVSVSNSVNSYIGGLVGVNAGEIFNCTTGYGFVSGDSWGTHCNIGGLVGVNLGIVNLCDSSVVEVCVSGGVTSCIGGLIGDNEAGAIVYECSAGNDIFVYGDEGEDTFVGGLVGRNAGSVVDCYSNGYAEMSVGGYVGGLVGFSSGVMTANDSEATICIDNGNIAYVGGLAGGNIGQITECSFNGHITVCLNGGDSYVGGLVGINSGDISECTSFVSVVLSGSCGANNFLGGLVGLNSGNISCCFASGSVSAEDGYAGGLVGFNGGSISDCYADVAVDGMIAGGLVGANGGQISCCYATGSVYAHTDGNGLCAAGGLVAVNLAGSVRNCFATGDVQGESYLVSAYVGKLIGKGNGVSNCYCMDTQSLVGSDGAVINSLGVERSETDLMSEEFLQVTLCWLDIYWNISGDSLPTLI